MKQNTNCLLANHTLVLKCKGLGKRCVMLACVLFVFAGSVSARHIKGGWIQYSYAGPGTSSGTSVYDITVYVFRDCSQSGPMPSALGIYDAVTYTNIKTISGTTSSYTLLNAPSKTSFDPCLSNPPTICYQIYTYTTTVTLNDNANGYLIAAQDANRITGIVNLTNSVSTGITFLGKIPGTINNIDYHINTSPSFIFKDTAIICYGSKFTYQFSATDKDGDSLTYSFGDGMNGTQALTAPPYSAVPYSSGFSGETPLGSSVKIDSITGLISGTAPLATGEYVIAVYVHEWRGGVLINSTRKELQITVGNCSLSSASLKQVYLNCDTYNFSFQNESTSSNITSYAWDFGVSNTNTDTSTSPTPSYTYKDTGTYTIKLNVGNTTGCKDSATATVKVYPGFTPSFTVAGSCYQSPFLFTDNSLVKYGTVVNRAWDFGDNATANDTASISNPTYLYPSATNATVTMLITSSVGCSGTFSKVVTVNDKPFIKLGFTDTLICSIDTLPLKAQASGTFHWSPNYKISSTATLDPIVYPKDTTVYTLTVSELGCIDSAKVRVNVLQYISVKLGLDSGICQTDSIRMAPISDALQYRWRESGNGHSISDTTIKNPMVAPSSTTTYYVLANLGYCQDSAKIKINVAPYPKANAGVDTSICFGSRIQLHGNITANSFSWSPLSSLLNTNTLTPIAGPTKTTSYVLTVRDTSYCPKPVTDTVIVKVIPKFNVFAGKDTVVTLDQPLQILAFVESPGVDSSFHFKWTPSTFLSNDAIYNPVVTVNSASVDSISYSVKATTAEGCTASDDLWVHVFRTSAEIFVPTAFTPNADGRNDVLKPILAGITQFDFFQVYNRLGQLVYKTTKRDTGWDGTYNGSAQASGAYVFITQGKDRLGNVIFRKGTTVLIR